MSRHTVRAAAGALLIVPVLLTLSACGDGTGPNRSGQVGVGFQVARTSAAASSVASANGTPLTGAPPTVTTSAAGLSIARGPDTLVITSAMLVVRDVKLRSAAAVCSDDDDVAADVSVSADGKSGSHDSDDDDCPVVRVGPFLVNVPVNGADGARIAVPVPAGTYSAVRLTLHKVTGSDAASAAFQQANPDYRDISVRLVGTFNKTAFTFVSDVNAKINVPLTDPVTIAADGDDVTVSIDFSSWFVRAQGGLYSPAAANAPGSVRSAVQNNIRYTFRAFRDHDRDGREDR
jgi:hypothetical protein